MTGSELSSDEARKFKEAIIFDYFTPEFFQEEYPDFDPVDWDLSPGVVSDEIILRVLASLMDMTIEIQVEPAGGNQQPSVKIYEMLANAPCFFKRGYTIK